jgi:hypothetical protein
MYYPEMQGKCGSTNNVGVKLSKLLCQANIVSTLAQANKKLNEWSQLINEDYIHKNSLVQDCTNTTILQVVHAQSIMINKLAQSHLDFTAENRALKNMVESFEITVRNQPTKIAESMAVAFMDVLVQWGVISTTTALESSTKDATENAVESTTAVESTINNPATTAVESATNDETPG